MKQPPSFSRLFALVILSFTFIFIDCSSPPKKEPAQADPVQANIKMYTHVWDEIINKRNLDMFNDSNFTKDVVMHANPDVVGIDSARAYYANYINGFSNVEFTIKDVFGQGDKLVKYWNFKGIHTGPFFGMAPTGKTVNIDGVTLVRMFDSKIAEERDFVDNLDLMTQLGLVPAQRK